MSLNNVTPGKNLPESFNVVIEIPAESDPVKYEVDKESGAVFVDRFLTTAVYYPCNYGYVPQTLSGDGDPVDVLVITPYPLLPGVAVTCRALGILKMEDEAGVDGKVLAVPTTKILPMYENWKTVEDVNPMRLKAISHFFEHYKDLEDGKWVKVLGWGGIDAAQRPVDDDRRQPVEPVGERGDVERVADVAVLAFVDARGDAAERRAQGIERDGA